MSKQFEAVTIPKWGIEMTHGRIAEWRCKEGDAVAAGDEVVDIETDKIVNSFEARVSGTLVKILVDEDQELPVGTLIGVIALAQHSAEDLEGFIASHGPHEAGVEAVADGAGNAFGPEDTSSEKTEELKISPALRRKLDKAGINPQSISGSGPNGRILKEDVDRALSGETEQKAGSSQRGLAAAQQRVAAMLSNAQMTVPLFHIRRDVSVENALNRIRAEFPGVSGLITILLTRAIAMALKAHPELNTQFDGETVTTVHGCNVAIAVARSDGAVAAPVVTNPDAAPDADVAELFTSLLARARDGRLGAEDMRPAAITLSNLGMFGVDDFTAMVTPPQIMVLSVGKVRRAPVWSEASGGFVSEQKLMLTLGSDHRVVNGAQAAQFLRSIASAIEVAE